MSYISLPFGLVRKKKKINLDLPKNYGASQYMRRLRNTRNEDPNFKNSIIDIVNNKSDLRKFLLAASNYGENIQKNFNTVVADGKCNQAVVRRVLDQKDKGAFESPIPLSVMFKDEKTFDIQNPIIRNLLSQANGNKINGAKVKQVLGQAKNEELQARLDRLRKRIDKNDEDDNINFNDGDDDDNNVGGEELRRRYSNLRRPIIPSNDNNEEELFCRYNNLKAVLNNDEELLRRYNDLRTPLFQDIPPSPLLPLKRPNIEKDYDDAFLPPQTSTVEALKTDFDRTITNLIDKPNNIIEMVPKNKILINMIFTYLNNSESSFQRQRMAVLVGILVKKTIKK